ncbi:MAG: serine hydrolase [Cupriavidus sp.]|nr:serine hydrolase [Cupriavidus sp.]
MLDDFDALVEAAMAESRVPGVAIAMLQGDETILLKGYGRRDIDAPGLVTADTQFLLCSLTKSFTATGLGLLVDEGKLDWNKPVREYLPEFRLYDAVATERTSVRDLLCHQSGLPRHDWIHAPGDLSMPQILAALRHLRPNRDLREGFEYQNLGYLVAGHIAERISGHDWETFTAERLLRPLGFTSFGFSIEALAEAPDHAHPHVRHGAEVARAALCPIRATPAGGLNASVNDLAKWLRLWLDEGRVAGGALLSPEVMRQMTTPHVYAGQSSNDQIGHLHYGFGMCVGYYRGARMLWHTGSWVGWSTIMAMLPDRRIGIAVLTNRAPGGVTELLVHSALDRLCGFATTDWLGQYIAGRRKTLAQEQIAEAERRDARAQGTAPPRAPGAYAGEYDHPAYGRIIVSEDGEGLAWGWRGMSGPLTHLRHDIFTTQDRPAEIHPDNLLLTFGYNCDGLIDRISAPLEPLVDDIVFRRVRA